MKPVHFDFRTKLFVVCCVMVLVAVLTNDFVIDSLLVLLAFYITIQGFGRAAVRYLAACAAFALLRVISDGEGLTFLMPEMFLFMVLRILMMVMAAHPIIGMPPGEVVAVFKKIHAPGSIALPTTFMLRFFPTVKGEFRDVFAALYLRGLLSLRHPLRTAEYVITPVIFRASRIAEELAASAESRGISNLCPHTCRREIVFGYADGLACVLAFAVSLAYFVFEWTVIR